MGLETEVLSEKDLIKILNKAIDDKNVTEVDKAAHGGKLVITYEKD